MLSILMKEVISVTIKSWKIEAKERRICKYEKRQDRHT